MEKEQERVVLAPLKDSGRKLKDCQRHKEMKRTIVCNKDKKLLCPFCALKHLRDVHKIDWLPNLDEAMNAPAGPMVKQIEEYLKSISVIKGEQSALKLKAAQVKNDKTIELRRAEAILEIDKIVKSANAEKNALCAKYMTSAKRLDKLKLKYESKVSKAKEDMDPLNYMDEGEDIKPEVVEVGDEVEIKKDMEAIMKKVNEERQELDKAASLSSHKDELRSCVDDLKKEVMKDLLESIKLTLTVAGDTNNQQFNQLISEKKKVVKDYEDEIKRLQEVVPKMTKESQELTMKSGETKTRLDETVAKLKEVMKGKEEEKKAGFVKCPRCKKLLCSTCSGTGNKCDACGKTEICKDCVSECSGCNKKVCKEECLKKCDTCGKLECLVCLKEKRCSVDDIYGNTIDLNKADKKYFYCTCWTMG